MYLLKSIRLVAKTSSSSLMQGVFNDIASRMPIVRLVARLYDLCQKISMGHYLVALYGLLYYLRAQLPKTTPALLGVAYYPNEIKQLDGIDALLGDARPARVNWTLRQWQSWRLVMGSIVSIHAIVQLLRILKRLQKPLSFMPACRIAVCYFLYIRFYQWLRTHRVKAVIITSDYSPDAVALSAAAAALDIHRIYIPHALPSTYLKSRTQLAYETYVFDSEAMRDRFAILGTLTGSVVYRGVKGINRPMDVKRLDKDRLRIGIFLSGPTHMPMLAAMINDLQALPASSILIRGHPVLFSNPDFSLLENPASGVRISKATPLLEDANACDLIIAPNTTVFLEVLKYGVPCVYCAALDPFPYDYNGFVADRLVPAIDSAKHLDIAAIKCFYTTDWESRMQYFDAGYGRDVDSLRLQMKQTLLALVSS